MYLWVAFGKINQIVTFYTVFFNSRYVTVYSVPLCWILATVLNKEKATKQLFSLGDKTATVALDDTQPKVYMLASVWWPMQLYNILQWLHRLHSYVYCEPLWLDN